MTDVFPNVYYDKSESLGIEVLTLDQIYAKFNTAQSHNPFKPHRISFYLMIIVTEGSMEHFVDFRFYTLQAGSVLFVVKNRVHHFVQSNAKTKGYCIILNSRSLNDHYFVYDNIKFNQFYNSHLDDLILHQQDMGTDSFVDMAHRLYDEYHFPSAFAKYEVLRAHFQILLLMAQRAKQNKSNQAVPPHWLEVFYKFNNKLEAEYTTSRSSRHYAAELHISYKLLNEVVKKLTNKTVKAFIDGFVIIEIKRYLISTSLSIKEIAYKTGFDEPTNLIKFFRKNSGITPSKFRRSF